MKPLTKQERRRENFGHYDVKRGRMVLQRYFADCPYCLPDATPTYQVDQTVAELMGWQWGAEWDTTRTEMLWAPLPPDGGRYRKPTPDDMLAWLSAHVIDGQWNTEGVIGITYGPEGVDLHWYCEAGMDGAAGRTLAAALENAVRAVAAGGVVGETEPADPEDAS